MFVGIMPLTHQRHCRRKRICEITGVENVRLGTLAVKANSVAVAL